MRRIELLLIGTAVAFLCLNVNSSQAQVDWGNPPVHIYTAGEYTVDVDTIDCRNPVGDSKEGIDCEPAHTFLVIDGDSCLILGNSGPPYKGNALRFYSLPPFDVAKSVNVSNFVVKNMNYGVTVKGLGYSEFKNIVIDSCYRGVGSWELTEYTVGLKILDNKISNTTGEAMKIYKMTDCEVSRNIITAAALNGIRCHNKVNSSQIKNNIIINCGSEGLYLRHSGYNSIGGNVLKGNKTGIRIDHDDGIFNTLTGDSIIGGTSTGLYFNGADSNTVVNMVIDGDGTLGTGIRAANGAVANVITDSKIINVNGNDIQVEKDCILDLINTSFDSAKVAIQDNGILNVGYHVTVLTQVNGAPVEGTVEITNAAGDKVYTGNAGDALAVVTYSMTADGALAEGPFEVSGTFNDAGMVYSATLDSLDIVANMTVTLDLERDVSYAIYVIREPGTYTFPALVDAATDTLQGIRIFADDVTIDGGNTTLVKGAGPVPDYQGIWPRTTSPDHNPDDPVRLNITVKDIKVDSFRTGLYYRLAGGTIDNVTVSNCAKGINVNNRRSPLINSVVLNNSTVINGEKMAIELRCGPDAEVINNTIIADRPLPQDGIGFGIERGWPIAEGGYATINGLYKGNTVNGNGFMKVGFLLDRTMENTFEDNTISGCTDCAVRLQGAPDWSTEGNVFTNTMITGASGIGVHFRWADGNVFDSLTVDGADVAIKAEQGSKDNVIMNSSVANSATYDVEVKQNANLFLINPLVAAIDPTKISVEKGSAIFLGNSLTDKFNVEVTVMYLGFYPLPDMDVYVENAQGDTLNSYVTDAEGKVSLSLAVKGISASGYRMDQNPFTISVAQEVDEVAYLIGSITESITGDVSLIVIVKDPTKTDVASQNLDLPTEFALSQNYPNPFNPETEIAYQLPEASDVAIKIYNVHGQLITTLVDEHQSAGYNSVVWNARDRFGNAVSSGLYFYSMKAGDFKVVKRMMLLK